MEPDVELSFILDCLTGECRPAVRPILQLQTRADVLEKAGFTLLAWRIRHCLDYAWRAARI
jgi:hypothetical protein